MTTAAILGVTAASGTLAYYASTPEGANRLLLEALAVSAIAVCVLAMWLMGRLKTVERRSWLLRSFLLALLLLVSVGAVLDGGHASPLVDFLVAPVLFAALTCSAARVTVFSAIALVVDVSVAVLGPQPEPVPVVATQVGANLLLCAIAIAAARGRSLHEERIAGLLEELAHQALVDPLTGLPNRRAFQDRLHRQVQLGTAQGTPFAVLMLDLDGFKHVNDVRGHDAGDALLHRVAGALRRAVREADFAARLGGDEFAVLLPFVAGIADTEMRIRLAVAGADPEGMVGVSVGVSTSRGPFDTAEEMLRRADQRMYADKRAHSVASRSVG